MKKSELVFKVADILEEQGLTADLQLPAEKLSLEKEKELNLEGAMNIAIDFSVGGDTLLLQANLAGHWRVECSRCLTEHPSAFSASFEETYPTTKEEIDLTKDIREAALMEVPLRSLCQPDCKGLCSRCGENLNTKPCTCSEKGKDTFAPKKISSPFDVLKKLK